MVCCLLLAHGDHGTLWHLANWQYVANGKLSLCTAVHELASVGTLHGNPEFLLQLVAVGVMEDNLAERGTAAWIMDDVLDQALHVALALGIVNSAQFHRTLPQPGLSREDQGLTLTGSANDTTHGFLYLPLQGCIFYPRLSLLL